MKKINYLIAIIILLIGLIGCDASIDSQEIMSTGVDNLEAAKTEEDDSESLSSSGVIDTDESSDTSEASDAAESSDTSEDSDPDESSDTSEETDAHKSGITSESSDTGEDSKVDEASDTDEVNDTSEANNTDEVNDTSASVDTLVAGEIILGNDSLTITKAGTYTISGSIANGQIIIDAGDSDDIELVLKDVQINCDYAAAIYVINADQVRITAQGNNNVLSISEDISDNVDSVDGVIYSKSDLIFDGTGTLSINSDFTHGIVGKDDIEFQSGHYKIVVAKDGIQANDSLSAYDTNFSIIAEKDGIQVDNDENTDKGYVYFENSTLVLEVGEDGVNATNYMTIVSGQYTIDAGEDGLQADTYLHILNGTFDITSGGGYQGVLNIITKGEGSGGTISETDQLTESMKAIKSDDITIELGSFLISSYEDALNANNDIVINGGYYTINSGDEAITAHNSLVINGGTIIIENGYEGLEGTYITINDGDIRINVLDDGINGGESTSLVTIAGGNLSVTCQGDGLDSNGDMVISGGNIMLDVSAIYVGGDGNVDVTGNLTYTGGTIVDGSGVNIDPTQEAAGGKMQVRPGGGGRP